MKTVELYSGADCHYCRRAKEELRKRGLDFTDKDIGDPVTLEEFRTRLPRVRSIPQIFFDGRHVGGYDDLIAELNARE